MLLGSNEVNSGSTLLSNNKNITIIRIEESLKVMLHECIHYLNLDLSQHNFFNTHNWRVK